MAGVQDSTVRNTAGPSTALMIARFRRSLAYALTGLQHVFRHHPNLKLELAFMGLSLLLALLLQVGAQPFILIILSWGLVLAFEVINTAVELTVDLVSPEHNKLAGLAKDVSAGAVLVAALTTALVNAWILLPPLLKLTGLVSP